MSSLAERRSFGYGNNPTLPGRDYYAPEIYELECERMFYRRWMCVGREEQISKPGQYLSALVGDESILVVRDKTGDLGAFYNVCRHRGARLADDETFEDSFNNTIVCPYHAWSYSFNGDLLSMGRVPRDEGPDRSCHGLIRVAVDTWDGFIFVNLSEERGETLQEQIAAESDSPMSYGHYRLSELRVAHREVYELNSNWKIWIDNYSECLHCPSVHPDLVRLIPIYRRGMVWDEARDDGGVALDDAGRAFTQNGETSIPPLPGLSEKEKNSYYGAVLFPNLMLNLTSVGCWSMIFYPKGPERTTIVSEQMFRPEAIAARDFDPADILAFTHQVMIEDIRVCELTQRGVKSRAYASGGVLTPPDSIVHFWTQRYLELRGPVS